MTTVEGRSGFVLARRAVQFTLGRCGGIIIWVGIWDGCGVAEGGSDSWFVVVGVWLGPSVGIEEGVWEGIIVVVI